MFSFLGGSTPEPVTRSAEDQQKVDAQTAKLSLYHFDACPFCQRVRSHMDQLNLNIELRDKRVHPKYVDELLAGGGSQQVPALRIEQEDGSVQWMYESSDIMAYLSERFA